MKKILFVVLLVGFSVSLAQEEKTHRSSVIVEDTVINNGWVIVYGELLKRPYTIRMICDTIFINEVVIYPPLEIPVPTSDVEPLTKTALGETVFPKMYAFQLRCFELYSAWTKKYADQKTKEMFIAMLDTQQVVKIKDYRLSDGSLNIVYDYKWGELYSNVGSILQDSNYYGLLDFGPLFSPDNGEKKESMIKGEKMVQESNPHCQFLFNEIKGSLRADGLYLTDFSETIFMAPEKADSVIRAIRVIINTTTPDSQKACKISELLMNIPLESAKEFIKNRDSWEVPNEK